jgi:hypothetical protein
LTSQASLGRVDRTARAGRRLAPVRLLLPLGWLLAAVGYYGPWISHPAAALTLSGVDLGEFVKFLPGILDGSLRVARQSFYLPPFSTVVSVALLIGAQRLRYPWPLRLLVLGLAVPVSLQLLPPAWSPSSLMSAEFRLQTVAVGISWFLLGCFWLLGQLPSWLSGSVSAALSVATIGSSAWQFWAVKPGIDAVYGSPPPVGWGFYVCMVGLAVVTTASVILVLRTRPKGREPWTGQ